jgi:transposase
MDLANEVRGLLKIFGIRLPKTVKHGSFDGVVRPMIEMDDVLAHALVPLLDARVVLYQHFLELDRRVKRAASHDEVCMRMMTVPGVGPIASLTFKAAVDDPTRFKRSRTVGAHFGLTPRRYQSGEHDNPGRISKAGDRDVRATLYAAANALLMRTMAGSQIKSWGMRLMARNSVRTKWEAWHDLKRQHPILTGSSLTGRGLWKKPKLAAAQREARLKAGSPLPIQHMRAAVPKRHQPDCEEKRDPDE